MKCEICGKGPPQDDVALHRVNELGVTGIWRCHEHLTPEQRATIDPVVADIVNIIQDDNERKRPGQ